MNTFVFANELIERTNSWWVSINCFDDITLVKAADMGLKHLKSKFRGVKCSTACVDSAVGVCQADTEGFIKAVDFRVTAIDAKGEELPAVFVRVGFIEWPGKLGEVVPGLEFIQRRVLDSFTPAPKTTKSTFNRDKMRLQRYPRGRASRRFKSMDEVADFLSPYIERD